VDLYLYYKGYMSLTEKKVLVGLIRRYQMEVPIELQGIEI
jgi:hypothetical protein